MNQNGKNHQIIIKMSAKKEVRSLIFLSFLVLLSFVLFNGCATTKDISSEILKKELIEVHNIIENDGEGGTVKDF